MIRIGTVLTCVALCTGQSYTINILGLPAVNVEQDMSTPGRIEFKTQNRGIFDMIWPARNVYSSHYDPETFGITQWQKKIKQGEFKSNVSAKLDSTGSLVYDNKTKVNIEGATQTIFTLLAMVQFRDMEALDTQWFDYEHEGQLGKARFVWSDSTPTWNGKDSILCDHYRLDIEIKKEIFSHVLSQFSSWHDQVFFYLWMEERSIWESVFGKCYVDNTEFENALFNSVSSKMYTLESV